MSTKPGQCSRAPVARSRFAYGLAAAALFIVELVIALFVRDSFVRPYLGDTLAVILVYLGLRAVTRLRVMPATLCALAIAFAVEFAQWFHLVEALGLTSNAVARTVLGMGFEWQDFIAYTAGAGLVLAAEALTGRWRS